MMVKCKFERCASLRANPFGAETSKHSGLYALVVGGGSGGFTLLLGVLYLLQKTTVTQSMSR